MSKCIRSGNHYKRHKYKNGVCVKCKANQPFELQELAKRREKRRAAKMAARKAAAA